MRELNEYGSFACRDLPDGRHLCVMPLTFDRARVVVAAVGIHYQYDDGW